MFLLKTSTCLSAILRSLALILFCLGSAELRAEMIQLNDRQPSLSGRLARSSAWPQGDVAMILHGTLSHRDTEIIQSLESLLGDEGVSTLAINLSLGIDNRTQALPCDSPHRHRESDASIELARWSAWLATQGVRKFTVVGHSRGANQIARYVLETADPLVARSVLIAPPQWSSQKARDAYADRHGQSLAKLVAQARQQVASGNGDALLPGPLGLLYCQDTRATASSFLSYYEDDPRRDTPTLLGGLLQPILVIAGSEDTVAAGLPAAMAEGAPNVVLEEIDGADHFFRDLYADELVEITVDFMHSSKQPQP
ncbi:MAG: pimeloyl-ACP methyl ester carboxylesterase [Glaciecola sp.]|jgi:pimeloyl-ACP methyl ester carboxylesterase|uniref:alpha/beta fold hydrolase n=1 Tax=Congregibacter sp. TaxID=2744308 RepID=UPI0039E6178D